MPALAAGEAPSADPAGVFLVGAVLVGLGLGLVGIGYGLGLVQERRRLHLARRRAGEADRLLRLAEEISHVGHWRYDFAGGRVIWSEEIYRIHGRDPATFRPSIETALDDYHPDDRAEVTRRMREAMATRSPYEVNARILRPDGTVRNVQSRGFCEVSARGAVRAVFGVSADLSALRQAEADRRRSDLRYKWLADNVADLIVLRRIDGQCLYVSPASLTMLGYAPDDFAATGPTGLFAAEDIPRILALRAKLVRSRGSATDTHRLQHRDGHWIWVEAAYHVVEDREGSGAPLLLAVARDVTERHERQEELRLSKEAADRAREEADRAREEADRASAAKSDFLAVMSHELRTPLHAIVGFTGLILDAPGLPVAVRRHAELVRTASAALVSVVNDVLDYSKLEAGRITLDPRPFQPLALAEDSLAIIRSGLPDTRLDLSAAVDPRIRPVLIGDEPRLRQVLLNFLANAVKFTPSGQVRLTLQLEAGEAEADRIRFAVTDSGIGIVKSRQDRLFRRFSQIETTGPRDPSGSGLGLAICKGLVDAMGGTIGVVSDEGQGSTFWFAVTLPHSRIEAVPATEGAEPLRPARRSGRLLLVEDVPVNQELGALILRAAGHTVEVVASGSDALHAVAATSGYDLVLMDVHMPGMDGLTAARAIRALPAPAGLVPIVAMTAHVLPEQIRLFKAAGMDDHVGKPLNRTELQTIIDRLLGQSDRGAMPSPDAAAPGGARFDAPINEELVRLIGAATVADIMRRLAVDLRGRFVAEPEDAAGRESLRQDAHAAVSAAGMLGFRLLSAACVALQAAIESGRTDIADLVQSARAERDWTIARIGADVEPPPADPDAKAGLEATRRKAG